MIGTVQSAGLVRYGLGQVIEVCLQTATNRVFNSGQGHIYYNSPPLVRESAFEFLHRGEKEATAVGADAFQAYSRPLAELATHYIYQRLNGPNDTVLSLALRGTLSILSQREIDVLVLNTGMSAFTAIFDLLRPGDVLYYHPVLYGCTKNKIVSHLPKMGITTIPDKLEDLSGLKTRLLENEKARMIVFETELNPTLEIPATDEIAAMVDEVNNMRLAKGWRPVLVVVDNTFPTFANMKRVQTNAQRVAEFLKGRPEVATTRYPGMTGDSVQDERAQRLMKNERGEFSPGSMIYFELAGEPEEARERGRRLLNWASAETSLRVKVSFGQKHTLLEHPPTMTHSSYSPAELAAAGISQGGIRLAMGWNDAKYVMDCLRDGLEWVYSGSV